MLNLNLPGRVFLCTLPTDMQKCFDGLAALVAQHLGADPLAGSCWGDEILDTHQGMNVQISTAAPHAIAATSTYHAG